MSIDGLIEPHSAFGQGTCLIRAEDAHAPEVFDGRELFDYNLSASHANGPDREVDAYDRGEQLRDQPYGERQGEKK